MPEILQEIGAAAGLAAVLGLAVLSVLYFSQARDVKRLREWAGRAPERAAEMAGQAVPGRVQAEPQQGQPAGVQAAVPQPAGAQAAGTAKPGPPAVPQPAGAQAQGAQAPGAAKPGQPVPQPGQPVALPAGAQGGGATKPGQAVPQPAGAQAQGAAKPGEAKPVGAPGDAKPAGAPGDAKPAGAPGDAKPAGAPGETQPAGAPGGSGPQPVGAPSPGAARPGQPQTVGAQAQAAKTQAQPAQGAPAPEQAQPDEAEPSGAEQEADAAREGVPVGAGQASARQGAAVAAATGAGAAAATQTKAAPAQPAKTGTPETGDDAQSAAPPSAPGGGPPLIPTGPGGPATPAGGRPPGVPPPVPPVPSAQRAPVRTVLPPRPMPQQTAIIPPRREPWYRRLVGSPRYLVLAVAGLLIVGGAGAFGIDQLSQESDSGAPARNSAAPAENGDSENGQPKKKRARVVPANVTVAVLNGTTVPLLAKGVGEQVESHGFELGTVANTADQEQQRAESVVLYAPGHRNEARVVGRRLGITQRQPIDPASQALAGDATVVVIAGGDLAQ